MLSKNLWHELQGLRSDCDGAQDFDLCLRANTLQASFLGVADSLYGWRIHSESTAGNVEQKPAAAISGVRALTDYVKAQNLDWEIDHGIFPTSYRANPSPQRVPKVHVILQMPEGIESKFGEATAKRVRAQTGVSIVGVDIVGIEASRNKAVLAGTREADCLFFLQAGIELKPGALRELAAWSLQPGVGTVSGPLGKDALEGLARVTQVVEFSQTCFTVARDVFQATGGFQESGFPKGGLDRDLSARLNATGLKNLYTPFAGAWRFKSFPNASISRSQSSSAETPFA